MQMSKNVRKKLKHEIKVMQLFLDRITIFYGRTSKKNIAISFLLLISWIILNILSPILEYFFYA